jgi:hypothetical protein
MMPIRPLYTLPGSCIRRKSFCCILLCRLMFEIDKILRSDMFESHHCSMTHNCTEFENLLSTTIPEDKAVIVPGTMIVAFEDVCFCSLVNVNC